MASHEDLYQKLEAFVISNLGQAEPWLPTPAIHDIAKVSAAFANDKIRAK